MIILFFFFIDLKQFHFVEFQFISDFHFKILVLFHFTSFSFFEKLMDFIINELKNVIFIIIVVIN